MGFEYFQRNQKMMLAGIVAVAFFISLAVSFSLRIPIFADSRAYDAIAINLVLRHEYREISDGPLNQDRAITRIGPGYEFFLAGVYVLFGHHQEAVWVLQALFHALTVLLVFLIARLLFYDSLWHPIVSIVAASFVAFSPDLIMASSMLLAENVAIFLLTLMTLLSFRYWKNQKTFLAVLLGFVFGIGVLVRTPFAILLIFFAAFFWVKRRWADGMFFLLACIVLLLPWTVRNYRMYHAFVPTSVTFGDDLLAGNNPEASGELDDSRYIYNAKYKGVADVLADRQEIKEALSFIVVHPFRFMKLTLYRVSIYFSFSRPAGFWPFLSRMVRVITLALSSVYSVLLFGFGLFGMWQAWRDTVFDDARKKLLLYSILLVSMPLAIIFIIVETRYRYPIYPLLAVFAGYGFWVLTQKRKEVMKIFFAVASVLLLNSAFDIVRNLSRIIERTGHL